MKKLVVIAFFAFFALGSSFAQPGGGDPAARLQRELDGLTTELGLSTDQLAKVTPIVTDGQKKMSEAFVKMREENVDRTKIREDRMKMRGETDKLIKAVITPEQGVKLDAYRKKQDEERAKRMQEQQPSPVK
jgi:Spy/CpxP family protein refolding chaperone